MFDPLTCKIGDVAGYVDTTRHDAATHFETTHLYWLIAVAEPPHEHLTIERLVGNVHPDIYLPIEEKQQRAGRKRLRDIKVPIVRPYFFVPASITDREFHEIKFTRGVRDFLLIDGKPAVMKSFELEIVRKEEHRRELLRQRRIAKSGKGKLYAVDEDVIVTVGSAELEAKVHKVNGNKVSVKLAEFALFGRDVVEVDLAHIRLAH